MYLRDSGRVQEQLIKKLERNEKQRSFQQGRFFRFRLMEIHNRLCQTLLQEKVVETDNVGAFSDSILKGLKKALNSSEFDFKYFISPIRSLIPRPNPYSLYMTQYLMEVLIEEPFIIDIFGTDEDIYHIINRVISQISLQFEKMEKDIATQLEKTKSLKQGTVEYDIALDELLRKKVGNPEK